MTWQGNAPQFKKSLVNCYKPIQVAVDVSPGALDCTEKCKGGHWPIVEESLQAFSNPMSAVPLVATF